METHKQKKVCKIKIGHIKTAMTFDGLFFLECSIWQQKQVYLYLWDFKNTKHKKKYFITRFGEKTLDIWGKICYFARFVARLHAKCRTVGGK